MTMAATAEILALPVLTKRCPACETTLPRTDFYPTSWKKDGCGSYCKKCTMRLSGERYRESRKRAGRKYGKKVWANHSSRERTQALADRFERFVKQKYGLSMEAVRATLARQHGLCANRGCGLEISLDVHGRERNRAVIDHCHQTGAFRGLLCNKCNHAEGFYTTNKNRIVGIIEYLDRSVA